MEEIALDFLPLGFWEKSRNFRGNFPARKYSCVDSPSKHYFLLCSFLHFVRKIYAVENARSIGQAFENTLRTLKIDRVYEVTNFKSVVNELIFKIDHAEQDSQVRIGK